MRNKDISQILCLISTDNNVQNGVILPGHNLLITSYKGVEGYRKVLVRNDMFSRQLAHIFFADPKYNITAFRIAVVDSLEEKLTFADMPLPGQHIKIFVKTFSQGIIEYPSSVMKIIDKDGFKIFQTKLSFNSPLVHGAFVQNLYGEPLGMVINQQPDRLEVIPLDFVYELLFDYGDYEDTYAFRCPYCGEILTNELVSYGKCAFCGQVLPQTLYKEKTQPPVKEFVKIEKIINNLNYNPEMTYFGKNFWEIEKSGINIFFQYDQEQNALVVFTRLLSLAELKKSSMQTTKSQIFDFLLRENAKIKYMFFSLDNDTIFFSTIYFDLDHISENLLTDYIRNFIAQALDYNLQLKNLSTNPSSHLFDTHSE